jgi:hypothetical protein
MSIRLKKLIKPSMRGNLFGIIVATLAKVANVAGRPAPFLQGQRFYIFSVAEF